jgi:multiple sugar transport system permease protein
MFLLPSLIFFIGFVIIPMIYCVYISFFDSNLNATTADVFIGLEELPGTVPGRNLHQGIRRIQWSLYLVSVPVVTVFSLWVSSVIFKLKDWALSMFRCIFYLPVVTGSVAVTVVWKWMYNNYYGIFNYVLKSIGIIE